jgi:hypothetical protein
MFTNTDTYFFYQLQTIFTSKCNHTYRKVTRRPENKNTTRESQILRLDFCKIKMYLNEYIFPLTSVLLFSTVEQHCNRFLRETVDKQRKSDRLRICIKLVIEKHPIVN